jgi:ATP-dependent DNA helicase
MLPLAYVVSLGQLIRDLISLDASVGLLRRWSPLDHLFLVALLSGRAPRSRRFTEALASQIDAWIESQSADARSMLFTGWVMGPANASKAEELLGSLDMSNRHSNSTLAESRKQAYLAMLPAIILDERSRGMSIEDIEGRWGINSLEGPDEGWRDAAIWLLSGHAAVFDVKCFYYHLREHCSADREQIRTVKQALGRIRNQAYELMEQLKYCSPLGSMLRSIRASLHGNGGPVVGLGTIRKLEAAGITTLQQVSLMRTSDLKRLGVGARFAKQIIKYVRLRLR